MAEVMETGKLLCGMPVLNCVLNPYDDNWITS